MINTLKIKIGNGLMYVAIGLLCSCGSESGTPENSDAVTTVITTSQNKEGFYNFPQPIEQVQLLQKAGATYDKSILNPLENVSKYSVIKSQALNLGVYGADLSYAAVFNQPQDVVLYLAASKKLAEALNIKDDFYTEIMKRMERSSGNKDSLLHIVSDVYQESNESLKENDQSQFFYCLGKIQLPLEIVNQHSIELNNISSGVYFVQAYFKGAQIASGKLVVME